MQQDSVLHDWHQSGEADSSSLPNTLYMLECNSGSEQEEVCLPLYYRESFFSKDSLFHPELKGGRYGVEGVPVPYTVHGDDAITVMLLSCLVVSLVTFARNSQTFIHQIRGLFYVFRSESSILSLQKIKPHLLLCLQTALLLSITYYFYTNSYVTETLELSRPYEMIAIFWGIFIAYFLIKGLLYLFINAVFFGSKKCRQWNWVMSLVIALEGLALLPAIAFQIYFGLSMQSVVYCFIFILVLAKILTFYECWSIFFREKRVFLQIILYFCALEIIPVLSLGGALVLITDELIVNF